MKTRSILVVFAIMIAGFVNAQKYVDVFNYHTNEAGSFYSDCVGEMIDFTGMNHVHYVAHFEDGLLMKLKHHNWMTNFTGVGQTTGYSYKMTCDLSETVNVNGNVQSLLEIVVTLDCLDTGETHDFLMLDKVTVQPDGTLTSEFIIEGVDCIN